MIFTKTVEQNSSAVSNMANLTAVIDVDITIVGICRSLTQFMCD